MHRSRRSRRSGLPRPGLDTEAGIRVRSNYEKQCVEFFEKHDVRYQYEPLILLAGRQFRPDFFLPDFSLFVEICGYNHMPFYRGRVKQKQQVYEKHGLKAVFISYSGRGSLERLLKEELAAAGCCITNGVCTADKTPAG